MFYSQDLLKLLWPQEIEKFKQRTTGKPKCDMLYCLFKDNEGWEQQFLHKALLISTKAQFSVSCMSNFCGIFLSPSTGWKNRSTIMFKIILFLKEILMNLDPSKTPLWFTTTTPATKSWSWTATLRNGFCKSSRPVKNQGLPSSVESFDWIHFPCATFGNISWFYTQNCWASKDTYLALGGTEQVLPLWITASALHQSPVPQNAWLLPEYWQQTQQHPGDLYDACLVGKGPQESTSDRRAIRNGPGKPIFHLEQRAALH